MWTTLPVTFQNSRLFREYFTEYSVSLFANLKLGSRCCCCVFRAGLSDMQNRGELKSFVGRKLIWPFLSKLPSLGVTTLSKAKSCLPGGGDGVMYLVKLITIISGQHRFSWSISARFNDFKLHISLTQHPPYNFVSTSHLPGPVFRCFILWCYFVA